MNIKVLLFKMWAWIMGKNASNAPVELIHDQMRELRPLPMGAVDFEVWADRIISGALVPAEPESLKFALASMIMHLGPTEDHKEDIFFMKQLRKSAVNQVADAKMKEIRDAAKARLAAEQAKANEATLPTVENAADVKPVPDQSV